jgi:acetyl-CoA carboxylase biotin carboxylase subunit
MSQVDTVAQTREEAITKMERALEEFYVEGIKTSIPFHRQLMKDPEFRKGNFTTKFMETFVLKPMEDSDN